MATDNIDISLMLYAINNCAKLSSCLGRSYHPLHRFP